MGVRRAANYWLAGLTANLPLYMGALTTVRGAHTARAMLTCDSPQQTDLPAQGPGAAQVVGLPDD
jgi:hypothetical protein